MFERYTDRARRVVVLAQEEARMLNHAEIDVEHLLLGLAAEGEGVAAQALTALGVTADLLRTAFMETAPPGDTTVPGHIPFTPALKRVLEYGLREGRQLGHNYIGTEHQLLALARDCELRPENPCIPLLAKFSVGPIGVRAKVLELLHGYQKDSAAVVAAGVTSIAEVRKRLETAGVKLDDLTLQGAVLKELVQMNRAIGKIAGHLGVDLEVPDAL